MLQEEDGANHSEENSTVSRETNDRLTSVAVKTALKEIKILSRPVHINLIKTNTNKHVRFFRHKQGTE